MWNRRQTEGRRESEKYLEAECTWKWETYEKKRKKARKEERLMTLKWKSPTPTLFRIHVYASESPREKKFHVTKSNAWHETRGERRKDRAYPRLMQNTKREKKLKTKSKRDYVRINVFYREQVAERGKSGNHVYRWLSPTSTHHDCYDGETWSATRTSMRWRVYLRIDICSIVNHANSTFFVPLSRFEALNKKLHFLRQKFV